MTLTLFFGCIGSLPHEKSRYERVRLRPCRQFCLYERQKRAPCNSWRIPLRDAMEWASKCSRSQSLIVLTELYRAGTRARRRCHYESEGHGPTAGQSEKTSDSLLRRTSERCLSPSHRHTHRTQCTGQQRAPRDSLPVGIMPWRAN